MAFETKIIIANFSLFVVVIVNFLCFLSDLNCIGLINAFAH